MPTPEGWLSHSVPRRQGSARHQHVTPPRPELARDSGSALVRHNSWGVRVRAEDPDSLRPTGVDEDRRMSGDDRLHTAARKVLEYRRDFPLQTGM